VQSSAPRLAIAQQRCLHLPRACVGLRLGCSKSPWRIPPSPHTKVDGRGSCANRGREPRCATPPFWEKSRCGWKFGWGARAQPWGVHRETETTRLFLRARVPASRTHPRPAHTTPAPALRKRSLMDEFRWVRHQRANLDMLCDCAWGARSPSLVPK